ncbi:MAG: DUF2520 domain-containing protein [Tannerella sp.]|jgi:predicted short-subunit dehydrogenase-like oxidoreductase (DUF2520 family)|nr:DUF2520 domain-containing protein [Tannerella sp.]
MKKGRVVFIGAGNVATHLAPAMQASGFEIGQIFSRSLGSAQLLAQKLHCNCTANIKEITPDADIYIFAVTDDALPNLVRQIPQNSGVWIHTAGSIPMNIFNGYSERYGVIYPLQTLSKNRAVDFRQVPLFIEANHTDTEIIIREIADSVSSIVNAVDSEKRKYLHLAAVFACNFTNYLYAVATEIIEKQDIDRNVLQPLIDETAAKLHTMTPVEAQTGPAVRNDRKTMEKHLEMIENKEIRELYKMISENILTLHAKNVTI